MSSTQRKTEESKRCLEISNQCHERLQLGEAYNYRCLTKRETEVIRYLVMGYTAKKTAKQLSLSYRTVESYIESIKGKFHCYKKSDIIEMAIRNKWLVQLLCRDNY